MIAKLTTISGFSWFCVVIGLLLIGAFKDGPWPMTLFGALLLAPLGLFRLYLRGMSRMTKQLENEYFLQSWQEQFETPFGQLWAWYLGVGRDGRMKP